MSGFHSASEFIKLGFILLLSGGFFLFIAFFSPYWTTSHIGYAGLWMACSDNVCYDRWNMWVTTWVRVCQAFTVIALVCTGFSLVFIVLYIYHKDYELDRRLVFVPTILTFFSGFCLFLVWIIWAADTYYGSGETLGWCYAFIVIADLALIGAAVFFLKEMQLPYTDYSQKLIEL